MINSAAKSRAINGDDSQVGEPAKLSTGNGFISINTPRALLRERADYSCRWPLLLIVVCLFTALLIGAAVIILRRWREVPHSTPLCACAPTESAAQSFKQVVILPARALEWKENENRAARPQLYQIFLARWLNVYSNTSCNVTQIWFSWLTLHHRLLAAFLLQVSISSALK